MGISIIIPCYNERDRLPATLEEITDFHRRNGGVVEEVIIVDDGSRDGTIARAMWWVEKLPLKFEILSANTGKWAAIHRGLKVAKSDAILLLDADGSASIEELNRVDLARHIEKKEALFGSRFVKGSTVEGKSLMRIVVSQGYRWYAYFWYWYATGRRNVDDMQCPFKFFFKSKLPLRSLSVERFAGDVELACAYEGWIRNHPIKFVHKRGSKLPVKAVFQMGVETIDVARRWRGVYKW